MSIEHKLFWLFSCLALATAVEFLIPLRNMQYKRWQHFKTNGSLLFLTMIINAVFAVILVNVELYKGFLGFDLFATLVLPYWIEFLIALMLLDLIAQYFIHYLLHQVPILWRFHQTHHSDTYVDATTGTRHHPIDYITREVFSLLAILILAIPLEFYAYYRLITMFCTYFTHANIKLPDAVDKALNYVIVTPKAHKFHHHDVAPWTDSNYGNIFVFWDKLFGTYVYENTDDIEYGVDVMDKSRTNDLVYQLTNAFKSKK